MRTQQSAHHPSLYRLNARAKPRALYKDCAKPITLDGRPIGLPPWGHRAVKNSGTFEVKRNADDAF